MDCWFQTSGYLMLTVKNHRLTGRLCWWIESDKGLEVHDQSKACTDYFIEPFWRFLQGN